MTFRQQPLPAELQPTLPSFSKAELQRMNHAFDTWLAKRNGTQMPQSLGEIMHGEARVAMARRAAA